MKGKNLFVTGDTHGDFQRFGSKRFDAPEGSTVLICGDFGGVWDRSAAEAYWLDWLEEKPYTFLFVDGNHENYDLLNADPVSSWNGGNVHVVRNNVIQLMRGQIFDIEGVRFFVFGGARSHDIGGGILSPDDPDIREKIRRLNREQALYRIDRVSWWKEEMPSEAEMSEGIANLEKAGNSVDCILTHCAPTSVQDILSGGLYGHDKLTEYLEKIRRNCSFGMWFFGHYHENRTVGRDFLMLYEAVVPLSEFLERDSGFEE
ncbi:MAG: metallophosphoesterase [Clostridia bacterium]|nr:metallophosphoesterase [Clostridia bacterium]